MKKKPSIFFDLDDLLFRTKEILMLYVNEKYNIETKEEDYAVNNHRFYEVVNKYNSQINLSFNKFYLDLGRNFTTSIKWQDQIELMDEYVEETIFLLSLKYDLWVVTSRQKIGIPMINYMLGKHFPGCFKGVHCVWEWISGQGFYGVPKRDFITSVKGEKIAFIDDSSREILNVGNIIPTYLFNSTGKAILVNGAKLVKNFKEIENLFL